MRLFTSTAIAAFLGLTALSPAVAAEIKCTQPEADWKPVEELKAKLVEEEGWTISNIKTQTDEGCYEVYGKDKDGNRVEVFFDPVTFEKVGEDS